MLKQKLIKMLPKKMMHFDWNVLAGQISQLHMLESIELSGFDSISCLSIPSSVMSLCLLEIQIDKLELPQNSQLKYLESAFSIKNLESIAHLSQLEICLVRHSHALRLPYCWPKTCQNISLWGPTLSNYRSFASCPSLKDFHLIVESVSKKELELLRPILPSLSSFGIVIGSPSNPTSHMVQIGKDIVPTFSTFMNHIH